MKRKLSKTALRFRTIVLSDVHLGAPGCQIGKVNHFLRHTRCDKLILNGDILHEKPPGRPAEWTTEHTRFIRLVLRKAEKEGTDVIYLRGNHDDIPSRFLPLVFDRLQMADQYIHDGVAGRYLVLHGDVLDAFHRRLLVLSRDIGDEALRRLHQIYRRYNAWCGRKPLSLGEATNGSTRSLTNNLARFEASAKAYALKADCNGIICGHLHTPANKRLGPIHYLNSGDWTGSNTALVEDKSGTWETLEYNSFCDRLETRAIERANPWDMQRDPFEAGDTSEERPFDFYYN